MRFCPSESLLSEVQSILINAQASLTRSSAGWAGHTACMVIIESVAPNQPGGREPRCNLHKRIVNFSSHLFYWPMVHWEDAFVTLG